MKASPLYFRTYRLLGWVILASCFFAGISRVWAVDPHALTVFELLKDAPGQNRPRAEIVLDPILCSVAQSRAVDMANRGYFSHVNPDGFGANALVERAGYRLPDWWGNRPSANYIESIAAGYTTPEAAWNGWMGSDHRIHLLAIHPFFRDQTHVGVGHYFKEGSRDGDYWVVITAPPSWPTVRINTPGRLTRTNSSHAYLSGRASSNPSSVEYSVENADGTTDFQPVEGTSDWSVHISDLKPGLNRIHVRSIDASGNQMAEASVLVKEVLYSHLNVNVVGGGMVMQRTAGNRARQVGKRYSIEATPAQGWVFSGWSGSVSATTPRITFRMGENTSLTATFVPAGQ